MTYAEIADVFRKGNPACVPFLSTKSRQVLIPIIEPSIMNNPNQVFVVRKYIESLGR